MGRRKQGFRVEKVFDERKEGQQGMILRLLPAGSLCKIIFHPPSRAQPLSRVRVFSQNFRDSRFFHDLFAVKLKMQDMGRLDPKHESEPWPVLEKPETKALQKRRGSSKKKAKQSKGRLE